MNDAIEEVSLPVRCRMSSDMWPATIILLGLGIVTLLSPTFIPFAPSSNKPPSPLDKAAPFILFGFYSIFFLSFGGWFTLQLLRKEIIADENGLCWRAVRNWEFLSWLQIRDYYNAELNGKIAIIETDTEKFKLDLAAMSNLDVLRAAIEQNATNARTKKWEVLGARPELDWPRAFEYKPENHLRSSIFSGIGGALWVIGLAYGFWRIRSGFMEIWQYSGAPFSLLGVVFFFLLILMGVGVASWEIVARRETKMRCAQKITVSTSGLLYQNGTARIECAWDEVLDYYRDPMAFWSPSDDRFVVVTSNSEWDFTLIEDRFLLKEIIKRYATNAKYSHWRVYVPKHEVLAAQGESVFNYRTRDNRWVMLLPVVFIPISLWMAFIMPNAEPDVPNQMHDAGAKIMMTSFALGLAFICWRYYTGEIRLTDEGIAQRAMLGYKFLAWDEIVQLRRAPFAYQIVGKKARLSFGSPIADKKILRDEIARRATKAEVLPSWTQELERTGT